MGKRSNFERMERDFYRTPEKAVIHLLAHLSPATRFIEPCCGDGALISHLEKYGHECTYASDISPQYEMANMDDYTNVKIGQYTEATHIITNPPWERKTLHGMIEHFRMQLPTWLLFDADWLFTKQSISYRKYLKTVVPIGRVSWMDNGTSGKDNCAWYLFVDHECETIFK